MILEKQETTNNIKIESSWLQHLEPEFHKSYMQDLRSFLKKEYRSGKVIFPPSEEYFAAFNLTPFYQVKVVILGQDPYHNPGQAHGLCFSVKPDTALPPSLQNIYKELKSDLNLNPASHGHLLNWAHQGVLLLNSVLTVEAHRAGSHQNKGWEIFTDSVIHCLNQERDHLAFILWGSYAQKKAGFVDRKKHLVLESPHPSPLSAHRGFFGTKPFSKVNTYLREHNIQPIDWQIN